MNNEQKQQFEKLMERVKEVSSESIGMTDKLNCVWMEACKLLARSISTDAAVNKPRREVKSVLPECVINTLTRVDSHAADGTFSVAGWTEALDDMKNVIHLQHVLLVGISKKMQIARANGVITEYEYNQTFLLLQSQIAIAPREYLV